MSLLSPERRRALEEHLHALGREARAAARSLHMLHAERVEDAPSALELFAGAAQSEAPRFFAARPSQGFELVALGAAARVTARSASGVRRVRARCEALRECLRPTPGSDAAPLPLWVGGMAFDAEPPAGRAEPWDAYGSAHFALPELLLARRGGETWLRFAVEVNASTRIDAVLERFASWLEKHGPAPLPAPPPRLAADALAAQRYRTSVESAIATLRGGELRKVVLACEERHAVSVCSDAALQGLHAAHPSGLIYAQGLAESVFLGATPELLVRCSETTVETSAVAATTRRGASESSAQTLARRLQRSAKERLEHALVVEDIGERLRPLCSELSVPDEPVLLDTGTLQHLLTPIRGALARPVHALDLVARLHPTPALGGAPRERALALIRSHERFDRGWYGGPLGWFDARGCGELYVALRCAWIGAEELRLYAGSGLVAESQAESEASETALKLASVRQVLAAP